MKIETIEAFAYVSNAVAEVTPDRVVFFEYGDGAAIYVDGKLVAAHHPPEMTEKLLSMLGVRTVQDPAFMLGQTSWAGVAETVEDAAAFARATTAKAERAKAMRAEAQALLDKANELDAGIEDD